MTTDTRSKDRPVILAVDDDEMLINIIQEIFKKDAHVITAKNTTEALPLMRDEKPDLVIMDDMMPGGVTGLSFLEMIRDDEAINTIPVIMLTASNKPEEMVRGLNAGAADYITKPFKPSNLAASVLARLHKKRMMILVVNENEDLRAVICRKFQKMDCRVITCVKGADALRQLKTEAPNLVIMDRLGHEIDGMMIFQHMRQTKGLDAIPVLFLVDSAKDQHALQDAAYQKTDTLLKPINPDDLLLHCARLMREKGV